MYVRGSTKAWEKLSPMQRNSQYNFCYHTISGGSQHIQWLESTEMSTAERTTQVRKTHWKELGVFRCLVIICNLNSFIYL